MEDCVKRKVIELKNILSDINYPNRSKLTTKKAICDALVSYGYSEFAPKKIDTKSEE